jgi:AcrR family transcriptional regulator
MVKILDAAKTVFSKKGSDATIEDVAKKAEVGVGTIYRRFHNKDQLAGAVVMDIFSQICEEQVEISKTTYSADKKIEMILMIFTKISKQYGKIHEMALKMMNDGELGNDIQHSLLSQLKGIFKKVIIQGQQEGTLRKGDAEIFEILLFNIVNPQVVYQLKQRVPTEEIHKYLTEMILNGLSN